MFFTLCLFTQSILIGNHTDPIEIKTTVVERKNIPLENSDELYNFLINQKVSIDSAQKISNKAKFAKKCGVIIHSCRLASITAEDYLAHTYACHDDIYLYKRVFDDDILRVAYRNANIISVEKNGNGFIATVTVIEGGAYENLGDEYDAELQDFFEHRFVIRPGPNFYAKYNIPQFIALIDEKYAPILKQYY